MSALQALQHFFQRCIGPVWPIPEAAAVAHEATGQGVLTVWEDRGKRMAGRKPRGVPCAGNRGHHAETGLLVGLSVDPVLAHYRHAILHRVRLAFRSHRASQAHPPGLGKFEDHGECCRTKRHLPLDEVSGVSAVTSDERLPQGLAPGVLFRT
jgi:hypothetical protein